jgi:hypothetical protein
MELEAELTTRTLFANRDAKVVDRDVAKVATILADLTNIIADLGELSIPTYNATKLIDSIDESINVAMELRNAIQARSIR